MHKIQLRRQFLGLVLVLLCGACAESDDFPKCIGSDSIESHYGELFDSSELANHYAEEVASVKVYIAPADIGEVKEELHPAIISSLTNEELYHLKYQKEYYFARARGGTAKLVDYERYGLATKGFFSSPNPPSAERELDRSAVMVGSRVQDNVQREQILYKRYDKISAGQFREVVVGFDLDLLASRLGCRKSSP